MNAQVQSDLDEWKRKNPEWKILQNAPMRSEGFIVANRRQELYKALAAWPLAFMQRKLNVHRLPPNPKRGHWEEFFLSEMMTMQQHASGQYVPLHKEMEGLLAHVFEGVDSIFAHWPGDHAAKITLNVQSWFGDHVTKPGTEAWQDVTSRPRQDKRA
jgi:hypothetical protein